MDPNLALLLWPALPWLVLLFACPVVLAYGVCLPLLWLAEWLQSEPSHLPAFASGKLPKDAPSASALNANSYDEYYRCLVDDCRTNALRHWGECDGSLPSTLPRYSPAEQAANLRAFLRWHLCYQWLGRLPGFAAPLHRHGVALWSAIMRVPPFDAGAVLEFYADLAAATRSFALSRETERTGLAEVDLFSAIRLLWFIGTYQALGNRKVGMNTCLAAYCLIYPITDNFLDDANRSTEEKYAFNRRLKKWIQDGVPPNTSQAATTDGVVASLLEVMDETWPRAHYRAVHFSLNAIHAAQSQSVHQEHGFDTCSDSFLEEVSAMKGGASLLAAAYLLEGDVAPAALRYLQYLGLGFQLLDDVQDLADDLGDGRCTLFTNRVYHRLPLDDRLARLLRYIASAPDVLGAVAGPKCCSLQEYLQFCIMRVATLLVLEAASQLSSCVTADFRHQLEALSPIPLYALASLRFEARLYDIMRTCPL